MVEVGCRAAYTMGTDRCCIGGALCLPVGHSLYVDWLGDNGGKATADGYAVGIADGGCAYCPGSDCGFCVQTAKQVEGVQSAQCKLMQRKLALPF